jgi:hypothetical protein
VLIGFDLPQVDPTMTDYCNMPQLMTDSTLAVGYMISLGSKFVQCGISEIDNSIMPKLNKMLPDGVWPRIVPGYASLMWFTYQVSACMLLVQYSTMINR